MPSVARQSNFELLRLVCMLMVLSLHSFWGYDFGAGPLNMLDFFRESLCICAVDCFILISGYFGIRWKWNSFFNLIFQILFYAFGVYLFCSYIGVLEFDKYDFLKNITCLYSFSAFVKYYIILYFLSPLLNAFVDKNDNKKIMLYVVVLFFAENFISRSETSFMNFCLLYLIGRWISRTSLIQKIRFNPLYAYLIVTVVITAIVFFMHAKLHLNVKQTQSFILGYSYYSPLVILQSVFLFLAFGKLNFQNRAVNWCAASCFAIYLIHMHPAIKEIGYYSFTRSLYQRPFFEHLLILCSLIIAVFIGSILVDKIRIIIYRLCKKNICEIDLCGKSIERLVYEKK